MPSVELSRTFLPASQGFSTFLGLLEQSMPSSLRGVERHNFVSLVSQVLVSQEGFPTPRNVDLMATKTWLEIINHDVLCRPLLVPGSTKPTHDVIQRCRGGEG